MESKFYYRFKGLFVAILCNIGMLSFSQLPDILICGAPGVPKWNDDVKAKLEATGQFNSVSIFNISTGTPTLAKLLQFRAILLYTDQGCYDCNLLGDNLAAYINAGGGVVAACFTTAGIPIGGKFNDTTYQVIIPYRQTQGTTETLGTIYIPTHPIMNGVKSFNGGTKSYRTAATQLAPNGYRIADWSDSSFLITAKENVGPAKVSRVDLGFYPPSEDARSDFWLTSTDGALIMANSLTYVSRVGINLQDSLVLVDLYNNTNGSNWYHHENWLTTKPLSTWDGVAVKNTRVTEIHLDDNNLNGNIPTSIGHLVKLQRLNVSGNILHNSIPSSIHNLENLNYLDLSYNHFTFDGIELVAQKFPFAVYSPQANISVHQSGNTLSVYAGGTLSNDTYTWFYLGKKIKKNTAEKEDSTIVKGDSVFYPEKKGLYFVKVTNSIATQLTLFSDTIYCDPHLTSLIALTINVSQQSRKTNEFFVYPNPSKNVLYIKTKSNSTVSLLNASAQILQRSIINGKGSINISDLAVGLYYLRNNTTGIVQKIIIVR